MKLKRTYLFVSIALVACTQVPKMDNKPVQAVAETTPMPTAGDAADDPAIWFNERNPEASLIIGTNKKAGLSVFSLNGKLIKHFDVGKINNVDIRRGFPLANRQIDIVAGSNRTDNSVLVMSIDSTGTLQPLLKTPIISKLDEVYGFCLYHEKKTNRFYAIVNGKSGGVEQWELTDNGDNYIKGTLVRTFNVQGQPEGCVADDELGFIYLGEEDRGIWKFSAAANSKDKGSLIDSLSSGHLVADVEGLAIYYGKDGKGYLIASSQGNNSYAIYKREDKNQYIGSFDIADGQLVDGVAETDGIEVTSLNLGGQFPSGLFIAQDGFNKDHDKEANQNFKIVDWREIAKALNLK